MSVSFAQDWQDRFGIVVLEELTVTRILWQAPDPVGMAARAKRGERTCHVRRVASPIHGLANRSLQGTVMTVEVWGKDIPDGVFAITLGLLPANPMILRIADLTPKPPEPAAAAPAAASATSATSDEESATGA